PSRARRAWPEGRRGGSGRTSRSSQLPLLPTSPGLSGRPKGPTQGRLLRIYRLRQAVRGDAPRSSFLQPTMFEAPAAARLIRNTREGLKAPEAGQKEEKRGQVGGDAMLYKRGKVWWYRIKFHGAEVRESARTSSKTVARQIEFARRRELEEGAGGIRRRK